MLAQLFLALSLTQESATESREGERFGRALLTLHDVDGDGVRDFAVGAPAATRGGKHVGHVLVLSGATRKVLQVWRGGAGRAGFGHTLSVAEDANADGTVDVLVGYEFAERTELRSGVNGRLLRAFDKAHHQVSAADDRQDLSELWGDAFAGRTVRVVEATPTGDLDGDGSKELLVRVESDKAPELWAVSPSTRRAWRLDAGSASKFPGHDSGYATLNTGDLDGDDCDDLIVALAVRPFEVGLRAISGKTGDTIWDTELSDGGATSGASFALLPDTDGDGVDEILVGISDWFWHGTVFRTGRIECLSGTSGRSLWSLGVDEVRVPPIKDR